MTRNWEGGPFQSESIHNVKGDEGHEGGPCVVPGGGLIRPCP